MVRGAPNLALDLSNNLKNSPLIIPTHNLLLSSSSPLANVLRGGVRTLRTLASPLRQRQATIFYSSTLKQEIHSFLTSFTTIIPIPMDAYHLSTRASSNGQSSARVGREILVQHLLVKEDDVKLLLELQKRIAEGEDMSDLAVDYSICPSKEEGGMLGWVQRGQMVPEFEEAAFDAPVNKVVKCRTKFGWHLLQVLSEREESVLQDIQPDHLHEKLQDPCFLEEAQLIDVREPHEVAQASLPGFQVLPLRQFGNWGPEITTKFDPQKDTYVLCHHGVRSLQVAQWLQTQGFKKVFNVSGGIHAYAVKADPSIPTY